MSKITFRADDDLIAQLEEFDASKSEVMREALRAFLDEADTEPSASVTRTDAGGESLDDVIADRVDAIIDERLSATRPRRPQDVNVNITLDGERAESREVSREDRPAAAADASHGDDERKTGADEADPAEEGARKTCGQCGEELSPSHVYCPNCGEKAARRVFCDCGDELRSDWSFCPSCGRRTPAADVLDNP